ncbi:MAG: succinate dehydrogenase, hydrophobic membrane anchor protein [Chloroflexota bacterium]
MKIFQVQRITAVALLLFMFMHIIVMHYPPREMEYSNIVYLMQFPGMKVIESLFLLSVLLHALTGSYVVLTDYQALSRLRKVFVIVLTLAGIAAFYWGALTIWTW